MARYERTIDIAATPDAVWSVLCDVEKWPQWTPSILEVERLEQGTFAIGSTARVKPKGFPEAALTVTELTPGRSFTWEGKSAGLRTIMKHVIVPVEGGARVTLSIIPEGPVAMLVGWFVARAARPNVDTEAESLKRRVEKDVQA